MRIIWLILFVFYTSKSMAANLTVYDGGEGFLARLNTDNYSIIFDTGSLLKIRENILKLRSISNTSPTDIFLTHLHPDHASGIFELVENYPNINIYDNCMPGISVEDGELIRWTDDFLSSHKKRSCVNNNSSFVFDNVKIDILWPTGMFVSKDHNFYSLVLRISSEKTNVLLMGDANKNTEKWLLKNKFGNIQNIDYLIVGHHGSASSTSYQFLEVVKPNVAIVPVNLNNARGYPSDETLNLIINHGANLWITGLNGDFRIDFD